MYIFSCAVFHYVRASINFCLDYRRVTAHTDVINSYGIYVYNAIKNRY